MTPVEERIAEALAIQKLYGNDAPRWIADWIATLALTSDTAGVERFQQIATVFECHLLRGLKRLS